MSAPRLVVFVAFNDEFKRIRSSMQHKDVLDTKKVRGELGGVLVDLIETGIGPEASCKIATKVLSELNYKGCLVLGYCGGLSARMHINDAVIADKLQSPDQVDIALDKKLNAELGKTLVAEGVIYKNVPLITVNEIIEDQATRLDLFKKTKAEAVDMEAYEIAKLAIKNKVPCFVLKTVVDDIHSELPDLNIHFKKGGQKKLAEEVNKLKKQKPQTLKNFTKNMKSGGDVLQKIAPLVASYVECYWSQCL